MTMNGLGFPIIPTDDENKYLYNGKELQEDYGLDWYDYGARFYDAQLGRFHTQDRFAEKYFSMTPYQYGANNPINAIDINGDSIWFTKREAERENGEKYVITTMHYTGKILNQSNSKTPSINEFEKKFKEAFAGVPSLEIDIQFSEASEENPIEENDHVIVLMDDVPDGDGTGESNVGGQVANVKDQGFQRSPNDVIQTMIHESGHFLGLDHNWDSKPNYMNYPEQFMKDRRSEFSFDQVKRAYYNWKIGRLNYGSGRYKIHLTPLPKKEIENNAKSSN